ncbi:DNA polymerase III subunit delta' [Sphingomonas sp. FW199]|uniref:DNA polymerase III subunit delta' n=1 Tax=Sphingomonas sp. FW199 TaxID=3400217 RepID=UPI003CF4C351
MTSLVGNRPAREAFFDAARGGSLHHAWLIAGPEGVGKASFATHAAARLLAASGWGMAPTDEPLAEDHPVARQMAAAAYPDFRLLARLPKDPEKPDVDIARSITVDQVRALGPMLSTRPSMGERRVILIDAVDDLAREGANALLKSLEEPPAGTIFLLISHAPGRLLPTIRSRCRLLRFDPLSDAEMGVVIDRALPDLNAEDRRALIAAGAGSPGRAIAYAHLDMAELERAFAKLLSEGDGDNRIRLHLAKALSGKAAQERYEAFLARAPSVVADHARHRRGEPLRQALDAYARVRAIASVAVPQSFDAGATVFEIAGILAGLALDDRKAA